MPNKADMKAICIQQIREYQKNRELTNLITDTSSYDK